MPRRSGVKLSLGASLAGKLQATGCGVPLAVIVGMAAWIALQWIHESVSHAPFDLWGGFVPRLLIGGSILLGAGVLATGVYAVLAMIRYAGFLCGTMLAVRVLLRKRWVDLATAEIDASYDPRRGCVLLVARPVGEEREVRLPVRRGPESLPAVELTELADAITSRRVRPGADDRAFQVADKLRELAAGPVEKPFGVRTGPAFLYRAERAGDPSPTSPTPAGPSGTEPDPHLVRNSALAVAIVVVPLLGGIIAVCYAVGLGIRGVVIAVLLGLSIVAVFRRELRKRRRDRPEQPVG